MILQDVALLIGVTFPPSHDWRAFCTELLGVTPDDRALEGAGLRLWWLQWHFGRGPPPHATDILLRQYAYAYMLALVGSVLFPNKLGLMCFCLFCLSR